jgi:ABC-type cobalamin/Fe3+-siderophores transport system ATPase subunit
MKLKTVSVHGLFHCYDHTFNLCSEGLTFLHSQNGVGKSTMLKMIYDLFKGDEESLRDAPFDRMDLNFTDGTDIIVENPENGLHIQVQKNEVGEEMSIDEVKEMMNVIYLSPDRTVIKKLDGRLVPTIDAYASELNDLLVYAKGHRQLQPVPVNKRKKMDDDEFVFWCKDMKAKLDFISDAGFEVDLPADLRFPPSRYEYSQDKKRYEDLAWSISDYVGRNYTLAESVVVFRDIINGFFYNKDLVINDKNQATIVMEDKTTLPLSKLSAGEKQILIMFYPILFHATPGSLVIVDEPEISLHVSWQQKLGSLFLDIIKMRDIEILVATHSPQVIHDKWDLATELRAERA